MSVVLTLRYHDSEPGGGICADEEEAKKEAAKIAREVLENYNPSAEELDEKIREFLTAKDDEGEDLERPDRLLQEARLGVDDLSDDEALDLCAEDMQFEWDTLPGEPEKTPADRLGEIVGPYGGDTVSAGELLSTGAVLARRAAARWESGDLAGAIAALTEWADDVQAAFPGLDYSDDEDDESEDDAED